jgi:hypothetical protein
MNVRRSASRAAFTGAAVVAAAALLAAVPTSSSIAASKPNVFSVGGRAWGMQVDFDTNPEPFPVQDVFNESLPYAKSSVLAGGVSEADAQSLYMGSEGTPSLLCTFAGKDKTGKPYCDQIPPQGSFPPQYPFEAHASYPVTPQSDAEVSGHRFGSSSSGNSLTGAPTYAIAGAENALAVAGGTTGGIAAGTPLAVTAGSIAATTDQHFSGTTLVTKSEATLHNVVIAGVIHIQSITSIAEVDNNGTAAPVNRSSVTISGVTAGPLAASIDEKGLHLSSKGVAPTLFASLSKSVTNSLSQLGVSVVAVGSQATAVDAHTLIAHGAGLQVNFKKSFEQVCAVNKLLCGGVTIPNCTNPTPGNPLFNLCHPPVPNPQDTYVATVALGYSEASNSASFYTYVPPNIPIDLGGTLPGTAGTAPTTTFVPGTPGTPGSGGLGAEPPQTAGNPSTPNQGLSGYVENLGNVSKRLEYLFPLLGLALIGVLAGRLGRPPARLPEPK